MRHNRTAYAQLKMQQMGEDIHCTTIVNMNLTGAYKINTDFENGCIDAGGLPPLLHT